MDAQELLGKVRKIEIRARGLSRNVFAGEYHSAFRGRGMAFSEVREYQYGDDIRDIDWNVTARHNRPYVKSYEEERELTVMLLIDVSASRNFGAVGDTKKEIMTEIAARYAPADIPPTKILFRSMPYSSACSKHHATARAASSICAGAFAAEQCTARAAACHRRYGPGRASIQRKRADSAAWGTLSRLRSFRRREKI